MAAASAITRFVPTCIAHCKPELNNHERDRKFSGCQKQASASAREAGINVIDDGSCVLVLLARE